MRLIGIFSVTFVILALALSGCKLQGAAIPKNINTTALDFVNDYSSNAEAFAKKGESLLKKWDENLENKDVNSKNRASMDLLHQMVENCEDSIKNCAGFREFEKQHEEELIRHISMEMRLSRIKNICRGCPYFPSDLTKGINAAFLSDEQEAELDALIANITTILE